MNYKFSENINLETPITVDKETFLREYYSNHGPLHEQPWAQENMLKFHNSLTMKIIQCDVCKESWPVKVSTKRDETVYICLQCKRDKGVPKKFSLDNDMVASSVPDAFMGLTQVEEMLIAKQVPVMKAQR